MAARNPPVPPLAADDVEQPGPDDMGPGQPAAVDSTAPDVLALQQQLRQLQETTAQLMAQLNIAQPPQQPVINVTVAPPQSVPRLRVFTGLPPTGGVEVNFPDWEKQVEQLLLESGEGGDSLQRVRASLRGLAREQVADCSSVKDIVARLRQLFGPTKSADDYYVDFLSRKIERKENPSSFLLRLWDELSAMNKVTKFTEEDIRRKLYRTFLNGLGADHQLLCLELRTLFGFPGTATPEFAALLQQVRYTESVHIPRELSAQRRDRPHAQAQVAQSAVAVGLSEADLQKIIAGVVEQLKPSLQQPGPPPPRLQTNPRPRGPCFCCGVIGHMARDCTNPPDPARAAEAKARWFANRNGPLNGNRSLTTGSQQ